jgi:hypothetical protein
MDAPRATAPLPWSVWCLALACVAVFVWLGKSTDESATAYKFRGQQSDYYNLLVDGFQAGHTHLALPVHPDRLSPDPAVRDRAPRALDASLYAGRYYLFYGVGPAVLVLWPYSALTGHDLSLNVPTVAFATLGFLLSLAWYRRVKAGWFPRAGKACDFSAVLLLAFATGTLFLVRRSFFYELPLALAYACLAAFALAVTAALRAPADAGRWLATGSVALGVAVSGHPNLVLLTPLLALVAWWVWSAGPRDRARGVRLALVTVLPAAALGAGLAAYNYVRFGSILEFGFNYGENVFFTTGERAVGWDFLWPNFRWYYLTPPSFLPYFPFLYPLDGSFRPPGYHGIEAIHGQFAFTLFAGWLAAALLWHRRALAWPRDLRRLVAVLSAAGVISALCLMSFGIRANRYLVDFQFPAALVAILVLGRLAECARPGRLWRTATLLGACTLGTANLLCAIQQFDEFRNTRRASFAQLSAWLNPSWQSWEKFGVVSAGYPEFTVRFPVVTHARIEPLLTTGVPLYTDSVYVALHPNGFIEFLADHHGYGGPRSGLIPFESGRPYRLKIELGSLLPPLADPYNQRFEPTSIRAHKNRVRITFDGRVVLDQMMSFFEAAPWDRQFGLNRRTYNAYSTTFSGQIDDLTWQPYNLSPREPFTQGVVRIALAAADGVRSPQPVLASGRTGAGSLLLLQPVGERRWRFAVDEWSRGLLTGPEFELPAEAWQIDVVLGPLVPDPHRATLARQLIVLDGERELARFTLNLHLDTFHELLVGLNSAGFSTTPEMFSGRIERLPLPPRDAEAVLRRATR